MVLLVPYVAASMVLLFVWFFMGVYRDADTHTHHLFLKHRPTFRFVFKLEETPAVTEKQKYQVHLYRLFVEERGGYSRSVYLGF